MSLFQICLIDEQKKKKNKSLMFNLSLFETIALKPLFDGLCERRGDVFCEVSLLFVCVRAPFTAMLLPGE